MRDDNFPTELTIGGDTYRYVSTNIKTEYSYRHNQYRDRDTGYHQMHEVDISSETADLNSIPEVLGKYTADDGQEENNEFLEFDFENVYQKNATPPPPEPVIKTLEINLDKKWRDGDDTTAPTNGTVTFKLHRIATTTREMCIQLRRSVILKLMEQTGGTVKLLQTRTAAHGKILGVMIL